MNTKYIESTLVDIIADSENPDITNVETFEEAGLLTRDSGLVITMEDGRQFQVTIVQTK